NIRGAADQRTLANRAETVVDRKVADGYRDRLSRSQNVAAIVCRAGERGLAAERQIGRKTVGLKIGERHPLQREAVWRAVWSTGGHRDIDSSLGFIAETQRRRNQRWLG